MTRVLLLLAVALSVPALAPMCAGMSSVPTGQAVSKSRVISVVGLARIQGQEVVAHVWVVAPPGLDERVVAETALRQQGAKPAFLGEPHSQEFSTTGLVWDQFSDEDPDNDCVVQHYNPNADPTGGDGETALTNTQATWTDVETSSFAFQSGGQTSRCPSLVDECPGPRVFDNFNDVAWLELNGDNTLGVAWYGTSTDEADMALNTKFDWHAGTTGCTNQSGRFDAQTVLLHENGHVAGLGHSDIVEAVMYPTYAGARCQLHQDDIDGLSALYPTDSDGDTCPDANELARGWDPFDRTDFADLGGDLVVDVSDLSIEGLLQGCVVGEECYDSFSDLNSDGVHDVSDLSIIGAAYGRVCA